MLRQLPDESVDCVVTSPPYWGLRDYGTGSWEGGDENCDHVGSVWRTAPPGTEKQASNTGSNAVRSGDCKCGARRIDNQLGLEPTPDAYIGRMVEVFREVRRVLRAHGTCWLNLGDSYATSPPGNKATGWEKWQTSGLAGARKGSRYLETLDASVAKKRNTIIGDLKPKDLVGIPWRVALALQTDGWYLRSDIIWSKLNPMPESVTDRPTKAHEYVFLLSKWPRYFFDQEAVREPAEYGRREWTSVDGNMAGVGINGQRGRATVRDFRQPPQDETLDPSLPHEAPRGPDGRRATRVVAGEGSIQHRDGERWPNSGRNIRSVWEIATQPFPEAHFATFPEELVRRCVLAGCPEWVCEVCGKPRERIVERAPNPTAHLKEGLAPIGPNGERDPRYRSHSGTIASPPGETLGWSDCGHGNYRPGVVLDPFIGSGTTALVARKHGRHTIGIELNEDYCRMAARRLQQLSLLAEGAA